MMLNSAYRNPVRRGSDIEEILVDKVSEQVVYTYQEHGTFSL